MIKLVSQFDDENSKVSLATPTCGGCCSCCCCCCLISTLSTSLISRRNFGKIVEKKYPEDKEKIKSAKRIGFFYPIICLITIIVIFCYFLLSNYISIIATLCAPIAIIIIIMYRFEKYYNISAKATMPRLILFYLILCGLSIAEAVIVIWIFFSYLCR